MSERITQSPGISSRLVSSFRDPSGKVVLYGKRVIRIVSEAGMPDLTIFLASHIARKLQDEGLLVRTVPLEPGETRRLLADPAFSDTAGDLRGSIYEHERIPFPSYPYEWAPEMLYAAGQLTLDLARQLLEEGYGLKDGTPYNVLFRGPQPVFVDVLSFERRNPSDPIWLSYAQFVRTFLLPLAAHKHFGLSPSHTLFTRRDGLEPGSVSVAHANSPALANVLFARIYASLASIEIRCRIEHCSSESSGDRSCQSAVHSGSPFRRPFAKTRAVEPSDGYEIDLVGVHDVKQLHERALCSERNVCSAGHEGTRPPTGARCRVQHWTF